MTNLKIYQICHNLITCFVTLTSPRKSQLDLIFKTEGSIIFCIQNYIKLFSLIYRNLVSYWIEVAEYTIRPLYNTIKNDFS